MEKILWKVLMLLLQVSIIINAVPFLCKNEHFFIMAGLLITGICCCIFDIGDLIIEIKKYKNKKNNLKGK